jgi:hypothetical protein
VAYPADEAALVHRRVPPRLFFQVNLCRTGLPGYRHAGYLRAGARRKAPIMYESGDRVDLLLREINWNRLLIVFMKYEMIRLITR